MANLRLELSLITAIYYLFRTSEPVPGDSVAHPTTACEGYEADDHHKSLEYQQAPRRQVDDTAERGGGCLVSGFEGHSYRRNSLFGVYVEDIVSSLQIRDTRSKHE